MGPSPSLPRMRPEASISLRLRPSAALRRGAGVCPCACGGPRIFPAQFTPGSMITSIRRETKQPIAHAHDMHTLSPQHTHRAQSHNATRARTPTPTHTNTHARMHARTHARTHAHTRSPCTRHIAARTRALSHARARARGENHARAKTTKVAAGPWIIKRPWIALRLGGAATLRAVLPTPRGRLPVRPDPPPM